MSYQKKFQFIWLTGLEVTATVNFDNLHRERGRLPYTDSDQLTAGPSENKLSGTSPYLKDILHPFEVSDGDHDG